MALYLYRLGRLAARRAWAVVLIWLVLLGVVGAGAVTLGRPFSTKLTIPGTEFQRVLDDLERSLPQAAGGIGTVVISTADGKPFTPEQKKAVADVTKDWARGEGVSSAADPFVTQAQLDDAATQVAAGKAQLSDGQGQIATNEQKIADGKAKLAAGQAEIDANAAKLADGRAQLAAGEEALARGQRQYDAGAAKLADGERQWAAGAKTAADGRSRLTAAKGDLAAKQKEIDAGRAALAPQLAQLPGLEAQRGQLRTQLAGLQQQLAALPPDDPRVPELKAAIAQTQGGIDKLTQGIGAITAGKKQLDEGQAKLDAGKRQVAAKEAELAAGERTLAATRAQLDDGAARLSASKAQLDAGRAEIETNRQRLADGQAKLDAGKRQLAASKAELEAGEKQLAEGKAKIPDSQAKLAQGERRLALMKGLRAVNERDDVAATQIVFDKPIVEVPAATKDAIPAKGAALSAAGLRVDYSRDIAEKISLVGPGELLGLVVAGVVLVVMLGSILAAGLPLVTALVGVAVGLLGAVALTQWVEMQDITPALALMLGLAVGIDYSLFLVNRHREQLARGVGLVESIGRATGTAGSAVLFAGLTVVVALSALSLTGIPFLGTMGYVAAGTVAVAVLVALTLTPALLGLMGGRVLSPKARRSLAAKLAAEEAEASEEDAEEVARVGGATAAGEAGARTDGHGLAHDRRHEGRGHGWGGLVTRHPNVTLVAATILLSVLAVPAASLKLGLPDASYEPHDSTAYRTYSALADNFGPGRNGAILAVAKLDEGRARGLSADQLTDLQLGVGEKLHAVRGVHYVVPVAASDDRRTLVFQIVPTSGPSDDATTTLVHDLRDAKADIVGSQRLESIGYAGQTVANIDISRSLADALPLYLAVVVGISLILLLLVFRSIVVPVLATAGFLLSVAAAFGALVTVYQWGWLGGLFGVERPGLVLSFLPTLVIGILFGLAMDYQMFLVSGMREAWAHGHTARTAVRTGFSHGARVVTAAALIMTAVFASFIHAHLTMIRPIGFALAVGVLIDAFVVRMTAMPAIMHLLGERAWYLPRWMGRILPDLDVEGTKLAAAQEAAEHEAAAASETPEGARPLSVR